MTELDVVAYDDVGVEDALQPMFEAGAVHEVVGDERAAGRVEGVGVEVQGASLSLMLCR